MSRVQWVERTVPADGDEIGRYLGEAWDRDAVPLDSLPMQSYLDLVGAAPAVTQRPRAVRLPPDRRQAGVASDQAHAAARTAPTPAPAPSCCASSRRSPSGSPPPTSRSSARSARGCSRARSASPSTPGRGRASRASRRPTPSATGSTRAPPGRSRRETRGPSTARDGAVHATYWIAGWPRIDVGAAFLSPLLLQAQVVRVDRGHDRADLAAARDPRGRGGADDRRSPTRSCAAGWASSRRRGAAASPRRPRAARRSSPTATPPCASPATSPSPPETLEELERALLRDRARRADGAARAAPPLRPAGRGVHLHAAALPGAAMRRAGASPATGRRPRTSRPPTRSSPRAASAAAASTSAATSTAARSATTRGSSTAAS